MVATIAANKVNMTSEGLGEMFEADFAYTGSDKIPFVSMGRTSFIS